MTVTDNNGCTTTQSEIINTPGCTVQLNTLVVQPLCFGQTGTLNWTNSGGGGSYTNTLFDLNTNTILYNNTTGSLTLSDGNYSLIITDQYGCSDLANISIQAPSALVVNTTTTPASCFGYSNGSVSFNATGGTPPYYPNWGGVNPNALPYGVYSVLITDDNGCNTLPSPISYAITEPAPISVTSSSTNVSCFEGSDGSASVVSVTGGEVPYSYLWSPGAQTTPSINGLTAGTYAVTITDFNGCTDPTGPTSISISEPNTAVSFSTPAFSITNPGCFGFSDGTAVALPSGGGTPPYAYFWSNGQTTQIATGLSVGTYTCTITDANGCDNFASAVLVEPAQIQANIITDSVSCNGANDGSATVYITGGSGTYDILWFNGSTTNSISGLQPGGFFVHITDNLNPACQTTPYPSLFNIYEPDSVTLTTSIIQNTSCFGGGNGSVSATVTGGTAPYTYLWNDPSAQTTALATGLVAGTYVCTVTDANNCIDISGVSIGSPSLIVPSITVNSVSCNGGSDGSASVSVSGGTPPYSYLWSGTGSTTASSTGLNATTNYFVSISDANGCPPVIFPVNVPQPNPIHTTLTITSSYNGYDISCHNSIDAIVDVVSSTGGTGGYTYSEDSIFYVSTTTFINLPAGIFYLWTKDSNGCLGTNSILINAPAIINPNITLIKEETCDGDGDGKIAAASIGGTGPPYSYVWNTTPAQTTPLITGLSAGTYTVSVTDANGCIITDSFNLGIAHELITTITTTQVTCTGGSDGSASVSVSGTGTPPYTYSWSTPPPNNTDTIIDQLTAGIYTVNVTDANGCTISNTATIVESSNALTITSTQVTDLKCNGGNDGSITITAGGGTGPYTYLWSTGATTNFISSLVAGTYMVAVTDAAACTINIPIIVTEPSPLSSIFSVVHISCFGEEDGSINTTISGGTTPYIYNWTGPSAFSSNTDNISDLNVGSYTLSVTDSNECIYTSTVVINEPLPLTYVVATIEPSCNGGSDGSIELLVLGGTPSYTATFGLYPPSYPPLYPDSIIFESLPVGGNSVNVTDANGCITTTYVNLTEPSLLVIDSHSEVNPSCYGYSNGSATFNGSGGTLPYSYEVLDDGVPPTVVGNSSTTNSLTHGSYDYLITDNNGCSATLNFSITQPAEIIIIKNTINNVNCFGESTGSILVNVLNAVGNYVILWTGPSGFSQALNPISNLGEGTYTATVRDDNNCWSNPQSFYVNQNAEIAIDYFTQNASCVTVADGMIFVDNFTGGTAPYNVYNNGTLYAQNEYASTTIDTLFTTINGDPYSLLITDANNCEFTTDISLDFDGGYNCIDVPIIISPNLDGTNDVWKPILDLSTNIEVSILNRWGKLEYYYSGNSIGFEWDGLSTDNDKLPSMDYYYIIKFNNVNYPDRTGVITLIR